MESLIQVRLQSPPIRFNTNSVLHPLSSSIPSTVSPLIILRRTNSTTSNLYAKNFPVKIQATNNNTSAEVDEDDEIPQAVFDRMTRRISVAVGVPIGTGMTLIYALDKLSKENVLQVPGWLPLFILLISFGSGALAMAYGTISTSWDPDVEGSFFGFEQIEKNWPVLWKEEIDKELEKKRQKK